MRYSSVHRKILIMACALLLVALGGGHVYAEPCENNVCFVAEGGDGDCTLANPCSLDDAVSRVDVNGAVTIMDTVEVRSTLSLSKDGMQLQGFYGAEEDSSLRCAVADGPCIIIAATNVTIEGLVVTGECYGSCMLSQHSDGVEAQTVRLVAWQNITVTEAVGEASLLKLEGSDDIVIERCLIQECSIPGLQSSALLVGAAAQNSLITINGLFAYGKMDSSSDAALVSGEDGVTAEGGLSVQGLTVYGFQLGSRSVFEDVGNAQVFFANGTVNTVHAKSVIDILFDEAGRFLCHNVEVKQSAFQEAAFGLKGGADRIADVYFEDCKFNFNSGGFIHSQWTNSIISSSTVTHNSDLTVSLSGCVSMTNSVVSFNSNLGSPIVQITAVDSVEYRMPTPTSMLYISSCDFSSNTDTPLEITAVSGVSPRNASLLLTTCSFVDNTGGQSGAISLDLVPTVKAQLMYLSLSDNTSPTGSAAVVCDGDDSPEADLIVVTFKDNLPGEIAGPCDYICSDGEGAIACPQPVSEPSDSESSSLVMVMLFAFVLILVPVALGACVAIRVIRSRQQEADARNLASSDVFFELEEYPHRD